jgi:pantoate--beta-alanine ligase
MVEQFALPVRIVAGETMRSEDGLALSSRNAYLGADERERAVELFAVLQAIRSALVAGSTELAVLTARALATLGERGWAADYVEIRRQRDLLRPSAADLAAREPLVVLAAARLGGTRLIDNVEVGFG